MGGFMKKKLKNAFKKLKYNIKNLNKTIKYINRVSNKWCIFIFFDIIWCALVYGTNENEYRQIIDP